MSVMTEEGQVGGQQEQESPALETGNGSKELCQDMFVKLTDYLNGELAGIP